MAKLRVLETLVSPGWVASKLGGKISKERLLELIEAQLLPHYEVDGEIMLDWNAAKAWIEKHMIWRCPGIPLPNTCKVEVVTKLEGFDDEPEIPPTLRYLKPHLISFPCKSAEHANLSGVYFLVHNQKVVYVGQSIQVASRVGSHMGIKKFDWAYYLRCPKSDLNFVEGSMIRILKPELNGSPGPTGVGEDPSMVAVELIQSYQRCVLDLGFTDAMHLEAFKEHLAHGDESKEQVSDCQPLDLDPKSPSQ